ncbi:MAG: ABC transporter permease subunit [Pirellulaceae bacterium]
MPTRDGLHLSLVHDLSQPGAGFTSLRSSERGRMIVAGGQDGMVRVFQVTTEKQVLARAAVSGTRVDRVLMAPKEDGLLAKAGDTLWIANFAARHPEVTWTSLFGKVWYVGYDEPQYMWQSSYATSAPEMKLSLAPLVFGTVKATFYTMLFAAPLALLAAIYSSEFMHPRVRIWVKPAIEMMASLPSVVLGFLAALVFAPVVEGHVTAAISGLYLTPVMYLFAAHLWQALPQRLLVRWTRFRLVLLAIPLPLSVVSSLQLEPMIERWLFAGNITRWLDGQTGTGVGAWLLLLLPLCAVGTTVVIVTQINPRLRTFLGDCTRAQSVALGLLKFMLATALTVLLAVMMSWLLDQAGWDPRGSFVSTYTQRNALIVGAVMGFAVIPIIYTIADDALSTVPQHLRSASLGCGATEWQTAIRVVVPTAMSGLFSALMIGLGRAVGETMIVLMAGGNTPVMEWNPFNGFRTLSANIATELPEAVRDSTHYRTLFFAALTLFLLTFFLNTIAELVRIRFRRRAYQL